MKNKRNPDWRLFHLFSSLGLFILFRSKVLVIDAIEQTRTPLLPLFSLVLRDSFNFFAGLGTILLVIFALSWRYKKLNSPEVVAILASGLLFILLATIFNCFMVMGILGA